jgi:hypothetical protein
LKLFPTHRELDTSARRQTIGLSCISQTLSWTTEPAIGAEYGETGPGIVASIARGCQASLAKSHPVRSCPTFWHAPLNRIDGRLAASQLSKQLKHRV